MNIRRAASGAPRHDTSPHAASPAIVPPAGRGARTVTVVSYNIHIGIGRDGHYSPGRIAAVLKEIDADVVALQEVPLGNGRFDMLRFLTDSIGVTGVAGPTLKHARLGSYGNAILTRYPVVSVRHIELSVPSREPRGAIDVTLDCHGRPLRVIATHLGLRPGERRQQVRTVLKAMAQGDPHCPSVLLGDVNEWLTWGRPLRWLHAHFGRPRAPRTFPAGLPLLALDRVWTAPRSLLHSISAYRTEQASRASDHLPVVATLVLPPV